MLPDHLIDSVFPRDDGSIYGAAGELSKGVLDAYHNTSQTLVR